MSDLSTFAKDKPVKLLVAAHSGAGKTGALASLANAGYKLWVLDFDNGLDILPPYVNEDKLKNVKYQTCTDGLQPDLLKSKFSTKKAMPTAYKNAIKYLDKWPDTNRSVMGQGDTEAFGPEDVLVIDSLSFMANAAMRLTLAEVGRIKPEIQDWYTAQNKVEDFLAFMYDDTVKCHVIVNTHIDVKENDMKQLLEQPTALGRALPPKIPRYFNTMLRLDVQGRGEKAKRQYMTVPTGTLSVKCPWKLPPSLPQATGLLEVFKAAGKPAKIG